MPLEREGANDGRETGLALLCETRHFRDFFARKTEDKRRLIASFFECLSVNCEIRCLLEEKVQKSRLYATVTFIFNNDIFM